MVKPVLKGVVNAISLFIAFPCALTVWLEQSLANDSEHVFGCWAQAFAILPGLPGLYLRRAYYYLTLTSCSLDCFIGFGTIFSHRKTIVEERVYIGTYALVGMVKLRAGSLIGSRASMLSGGSQHDQDVHGEWLAADVSRFQSIEIGPAAWIGEAAVVLARVGRGAQVCAGTVVSSPVPSGVVVAGNPARFARRLGNQDGEDETKSDVDGPVLVHGS